MKISSSGIALIKQFEGFTSTPRIDHKRVSIGYGNTFYPNGKAVQITDAPISLERGEELLKHSLLYFERVVNRLVSATLTQPQFDALVSLCYNIGEGNFQRSTLLKMVNDSPDNPNILSLSQREVLVISKIVPLLALLGKATRDSSSRKE